VLENHKNIKKKTLQIVVPVRLCSNETHFATFGWFREYTAEPFCQVPAQPDKMVPQAPAKADKMVPQNNSRLQIEGAKADRKLTK